MSVTLSSNSPPCPLKKLRSDNEFREQRLGILYICHARAPHTSFLTVPSKPLLPLYRPVMYHEYLTPRILVNFFPSITLPRKVKISGGKWWGDLGLFPQLMIIWAIDGLSCHVRLVSKVSSLLCRLLSWIISLFRNLYVHWKCFIIISTPKYLKTISQGKSRESWLMKLIKSSHNGRKFSISGKSLVWDMGLATCPNNCQSSRCERQIPAGIWKFRSHSFCPATIYHREHLSRDFQSMSYRTSRKVWRRLLTRALPVFGVYCCQSFSVLVGSISLLYFQNYLQKIE